MIYIASLNSYVGQLINRRASFICFSMFNASIKVLKVVAECPKDKDILRTFYPKYC